MTQTASRQPNDGVSISLINTSPSASPHGCSYSLSYVSSPSLALSSHQPAVPAAPPPNLPTSHFPPSTNPQAPSSSRLSPNTKISPPYSLLDNRTFVNAICGATAGMASGIVTCPLDVVKTRLQAQGAWRRSFKAGSPPLYIGLVGTAKTIIKQDGLRGFYRGLSPMLLGYLPTWAVYMSIYDRARGFYYSRIGAIENKTIAQMCAAVTAGGSSTLVTNPIWVIKTRLMSQVGLQAPAEARPPWQYTGIWDAARKMQRSEGLRVFYSGLGPAMLGLSHVAIQFPLYEYLKKRFTGMEMGQYETDHHHEHYFVGISAASFLSKVAASTATYPHEVLRTRLQTQQRTLPTPSHEEVTFRGGLGHINTSRGPGTASSDGMINTLRYRGLIRTVRSILAEEGWRAFYNGLGTNLFRAVPAAMTTIITYETLKTLVHNTRPPSES